MLNKTKGQAAPSSSFVGSIKDVQVNGETINFAGSIFSVQLGINESLQARNIP